MRFRARNTAAVLIFISCNAGCTSSDDAPASIASSAVVEAAPSSSIDNHEVEGPVKIGDPYQIDGRTYIPQDVKSYDEVGYASWYGADFEGQKTANGERFMEARISGAHKTLPLPSYVEVTSLETGKTIVVRLNDRGPFANDRLIDLSSAAAVQLGMERNGIAAVRVRKVHPPQTEKYLLREGRHLVQRIPTPEPLLKILRAKLEASPHSYANALDRKALLRATEATSTGATQATLIKADMEAREVAQVAYQKSQNPSMTGNRTTDASQTPQQRVAASPQEKPAPPAQGAYMVQIGAFVEKAGAEFTARKAGANIYRAGRFYRVRTGPFANQAAANKGVAQAKAKGYSDARIVRAD